MGYRKFSKACQFADSACVDCLKGVNSRPPAACPWRPLAVTKLHNGRAPGGAAAAADCCNGRPRRYDTRHRRWRRRLTCVRSRLPVACVSDGLPAIEAPPGGVDGNRRPAKLCND